MKLPKGWKTTALGEILGQPESGVSVVCDEKAPPDDKPGVLRLSCVMGGRFNPKDLKTPVP